MPIYTVRPLSGNQRPSPLFKSKGLGNEHPSSLSSTEIRSFPHKTQIAYVSYMHHLSAFLYATQEKRRVPVYPVGFPVTLKYSDCLPLSPPPVGVHFDKKPGADKRTKYTEQYGARELPSKGQTVFVFDRMTPEIAKELSRDGAKADTRAPNGVANLGGYRAFQMCAKLLTLFVCSSISWRPLV
jgi:hypothetical protein